MKEGSLVVFDGNFVRFLEQNLKWKNHLLVWDFAKCLLIIYLSNVKLGALITSERS